MPVKMQLRLGKRYVFVCFLLMNFWAFCLFVYSMVSLRIVTFSMILFIIANYEGDCNQDGKFRYVKEDESNTLTV